MRAGLPIVAAAAVLLLAGCGNSDKKANKEYANSVCTAIGDWEQQVKSIATNLNAGISKATLQQKAKEIGNATGDLGTQLKAIPPPDTDDGQAAKQQLQQLSTDATATVGALTAAVDQISADSSPATIAAAVITLAPQVRSLASTAKSSLSTLRAAGGGLADAFKSADACKSLT